MPINTNLLVAAPMLQDYLVDKDTGFPLAGGIISLYKDNARSFYKNWYYQTGIPGAYTWVALDNPLTLSSVGTIQDPNGNDVIPFYYPFQEDNEQIAEPYYITVYSADSNGDPAVLQFTRENFPFEPSGISPTATSPTWRNYILNNVYWRNIGSLDAMNVTDQIIAPSQHDGYTNGDIRFRKNVAGADDDLIFLPMTQVLDNDITPETMLNFTCNSIQVGETLKCIQYPISLHVNTLNSVEGTIIFHGQNVAGNPNNFVDLYFYQFLGTGALAQSDPILIQRVVLNNDFERTLVPFITPSSDGLVLGNGGDDALFLQVQYPLSAVCNINHTKPQIYLSDDVPDNDFDTYDQIETIINSPRTGDYRTSLNSFSPFGFVAANDGSIGSAASSASSRKNIDTWPLYNLLYISMLDVWAPVSSGRTAPGNTTATAYVDFSANKTLTLTRNMGRVLAGLNPLLNITSTFAAAASTDLLTISSTTNYPTGTPVQLTTLVASTPLVINTVYYVINISPTTLQLATNLDLAYAATPIDITVDGTGVIQTALGAQFGESTHTQTIAEIAAHNHTSASGKTFVVGNGGDVGNQFDGGTHGSTDATTNMVGSSTPFNQLQPTTFVNVFLKL
jgi:hypothetical protein